jgi:transcription initiation factor IIE alpha subunit
MSTIAGARGQKFAMMHCSKKHSFLLNEAYTDDFGTWCPECGSDAHSYKSEDCCFLQ